MMNLKRFVAKKKQSHGDRLFSQQYSKTRQRATEIDSFANNILFVNLPSLWTDHYRPWVD